MLHLEYPIFIENSKILSQKKIKNGAFFKHVKTFGILLNIRINPKSYENIKTVKFIKAFHLFKSVINFSAQFRFRLISDQKFFSSMWPLMTLKVLSKGFSKKCFRRSPVITRWSTRCAQTAKNKSEMPPRFIPAWKNKTFFEDGAKVRIFL